MKQNIDIQKISKSKNKNKHTKQKNPTKQKQIIVKLAHSISYHKPIFKCKLNAFLY